MTERMNKVSEIRMVTLSPEAMQAIVRLRATLNTLEESATDAEIEDLIDLELNKLPDIKSNPDKRRLFESNLWSL